MEKTSDWLTFDDFLAEQLKDPEFRKEYEALQPEYELISSMIKARNEGHITQEELSRRTGIAQSDISKLEGGNANPTLKFLKRIADGLGMALRVEFVPKSTFALG